MTSIASPNFCTQNSPPPRSLNDWHRCKKSLIWKIRDPSRCGNFCREPNSFCFLHIARQIWGRRKKLFVSLFWPFINPLKLEISQVLHNFLSVSFWQIFFWKEIKFLVTVEKISGRKIVQFSLIDSPSLGLQFFSICDSTLFWPKSGADSCLQNHPKSLQNIKTIWRFQKALFWRQDGGPPWRDSKTVIRLSPFFWSRLYLSTLGQCTNPFKSMAKNKKMKKMTLLKIIFSPLP